MNYLYPIHKNNTGIAYAIKNKENHNTIHKVQLQIGDFSMLMTREDIPNFLKVLKTIEQKFSCEQCSSRSYRIVKCDTMYASVNIKANKKMLKDLKELVIENFEEFSKSKEFKNWINN